MNGGDTGLVAPRDIKVWCFHGLAVMAMVLSGRFVTEGAVAARNTFSLPQWLPLSLTLDGDMMPANPEVDAEAAPASSIQHEHARASSVTGSTELTEYVRYGVGHVRAWYLYISARSIPRVGRESRASLAWSLVRHVRRGVTASRNRPLSRS